MSRGLPMAVCQEALVSSVAGGPALLMLAKTMDKLKGMPQAWPG